MLPTSGIQCDCGAWLSEQSSLTYWGILSVKYHVSNTEGPPLPPNTLRVAISEGLPSLKSEKLLHERLYKKYEKEDFDF